MLSHHFEIFPWDRVELVIGFTFMTSGMTMWCDCSHENKRHLPLGWKAMTNLETILQSWEIIEQDMNSQSWFSGVTYGGVSRNTRTDCQNMGDWTELTPILIFVHFFFLLVKLYFFFSSFEEGISFFPERDSFLFVYF